MWMKFSFLLIAFLAWDYVTADEGQSALGRAQTELMKIEPVAEVVEYVKDGSLARDVSDFASESALATATLLASKAKGEPVKLASAEAQTDETSSLDTSSGVSTGLTVVPPPPPGDKRHQLSADDITAIAKALAELQQASTVIAEEKEEAAGETAGLSEPAEKPGSDDPAAEMASLAGPDDVPTEAKPADTELVEDAIDLLGPDLLSAIVAASKATGANSGYLLHIAMRESGLVLTAQAPTSSANGPFQFVRQTWYQMLGAHGAKHGFAEEARMLEEEGGRYRPISDEAGEKLLVLRSDPHAAALMAGELTVSNRKALERMLDRTPNHGELYAAHVFGAGGAVKLIRTREKSAGTLAASILPSAARANRWLFYDRQGAPVSVAALFGELSRFMSTREVAQVCKAELNFVAGI